MKDLLNKVNKGSDADKVHDITIQLNKKFKFEKFRELLASLFLNISSDILQSRISKIDSGQSIQH